MARVELGLGLGHELASLYLNIAQHLRQGVFIGWYLLQVLIVARYFADKLKSKVGQVNFCYKLSIRICAMTVGH